MTLLKSQREKQMHAGSIEFETILRDLGRGKTQREENAGYGKLPSLACPLFLQQQCTCWGGRV